MNKFINEIFTQRDNITFSMTKIIGIAGSSIMIAKFIESPSPDYQGFGIGISAVMTALAVKYYTEGK